MKAASLVGGRNCLVRIKLFPLESLAIGFYDINETVLILSTIKRSLLLSI